MKKIVIYQSGTGFTQQYAQWIAEECGCEAKSLKAVTEKEMREQSLIIYGGWVMGNMISGLNQIRKVNPANLVVFAVGAVPQEIVDQAAIREVNHLNSIPFFYMEGGFRFEKLGFVQRTMLKMVKKRAEKEKEKNEQTRFMAENLGTSFDHTDCGQIRPKVNLVM